jgi:hypothetical protein
MSGFSAILVFECVDGCGLVDVPRELVSLPGVDIFLPGPCGRGSGNSEGRCLSSSLCYPE